MKFKISLFSTLLLGALGFAQNPNGTWVGDLVLPNVNLPIVFHVQTDENGQISSTLDSPKQNAYGLKSSSTSFKAPFLNISLEQLKMDFTGEVISDSLKGTFTQGGMAFPLKMARQLSDEAILNRPQTPKKAVGYSSKEVQFENAKANVTLAATLTLPLKECKAAVVLISGSGPQTRNTDLFEHQTFHVLADYLSQKGYAVLRYDDRGVGASTGDFDQGTTYDFVEDADAALAFVRAQPELKKLKVGVIGHSEGGIIAPMLKNQPDFIISLAGSGLRGDLILLDQQATMMKANGVSDNFINKILGVSSDFFSIVRSSENYIQAVQQFSEQYANDQDESVRGQADGLANALNPWLFEFIRIDPAKYWSNVSCPVLLVNGSKDTQVNATTNIPAISNALKKANNKNVKTVVLNDINHLMQRANSGSIEEYYEIEETVNPAVLEAITQFLATIK